MIDSHCHLADAQFADDLQAVLGRAALEGVATMVTIGDSIEESKKCIELAENHEQIFCAIGVHPHNAKEWTSWDLQTFKALAASSPKVRAIGEIGLDYHYDFSEPADQRTAFLQQLMLAKEVALPVVVHCREAVNDVWAIVDDVKPEKLVIHCCTEKWKDVERFVERGYLLSFTGIATYANAQDVRDCIRHCPLSQMMIETDAPYLAPVPHRGKRNEPSFVTEVAKLIAQEKGVSLQEVDVATTRNAVEFFGLSQ